MDIKIAIPRTRVNDRRPNVKVGWGGGLVVGHFDWGVGIGVGDWGSGIGVGLGD